MKKQQHIKTWFQHNFYIFEIPTAKFQPKASLLSCNFGVLSYLLFESKHSRVRFQAMLTRT